jgi:hypothetical protein
MTSTAWRRTHPRALPEPYSQARASYRRLPAHARRPDPSTLRCETRLGLDFRRRQRHRSVPELRLWCSGTAPLARRCTGDFAARRWYNSVMDEGDLVSGGRPDSRPQWARSMSPGFGRGRAEVYAVASVALWGSAAALALGAPFLQLFVVDPGGRSQAVAGVDGWGRVGAAVGLPTHEPRFGIGLWACAWALAWLAARRGRAMYRTERELDLVAAGAAVGVPVRSRRCHRQPGAVRAELRLPTQWSPRSRW